MPGTELQNTGLYIPTTYIFDIQEIQNADIDSPEFKDLLVRMYQTINDLALAANLKTTGYYLTTEFNTSQFLFNATNDFTQIRNIYRTVVNFGALPAAGAKSVAHGITGIGTTYSMVKLYGAATNPSTPVFIPIPFSSASAVASNLQLNADATNVTITTGGTDYSAYTVTYVILEYVAF